MWRKLLGILLCVVVSVPMVMLESGNVLALIQKEDTIVTVECSKCWVEVCDDVTILHLKGSYYEMGYGYGSLVKDKIVQNVRAVYDFLEEFNVSYSDLLVIWDIMKEYIPLEILEEMQGMANGSGIPFEQIAAVNMLGPVYHDISCSGSAAWGPATLDGKLYHMRSYDTTLDIRDPVTGTYLQENQILIVREPDTGFASLYPAIACDIGSVGGINEHGIGVGYKLSWSYSDTTFHGIPKEVRMKMVLDQAATVEEAIDIINTNRTKGGNFIISDSKVPIGFIVEQSANLSYVGTWDDPVESTTPFWQMDHIVRRTNCFIDPSLAATQRVYYNPRGLCSLLGMLKGEKWFVIWIHYNTLSNELENHWGTMDLNATMSMLRTVYRGYTGILWFLIQHSRVAYNSMHQWVACPETGDMVISFASADNSAFENPVHYFNLFELLDS